MSVKLPVAFSHGPVGMGPVTTDGPPAAPVLPAFPLGFPEFPESPGGQEV
ncbi:MAG: hypothetical protein WDO74_30660 [Pseudomonadota bacterium]